VKKPHFYKEISSNIKTYYCFELFDDNWILYDYEMRNPVKFENYIGWGSKNIVWSLINMLPSDCNVLFFKINRGIGGVKRSLQVKRQYINAIDSSKLKPSVTDNTKWYILDTSNIVYFCFILKSGMWALFDSYMVQPIVDSENRSIRGYDTSGVVKKLISKIKKTTPHSSIFYYKQLDTDQAAQGENDSRKGFQLVAIKTPSGKPKDPKESRETTEFQKDEMVSEKSVVQKTNNSISDEDLNK
jgi:hypothetical protein